MSKITLNDSHRFDDIADTCADAINLALIEKVIYNQRIDESTKRQEIKQLVGQLNKKARLRTGRHG
jgi:hypothetical protein